mmetsp:Transcript_102461/g.306067  ORF Transcript_102461/g.306067 Transcript_102461/m.306067 type:complete len:200 (+) Transcript_102461:45-644(+)
MPERPTRPNQTESTQTEPERGEPQASPNRAEPNRSGAFMHQAGNSPVAVLTLLVRVPFARQAPAPEAQLTAAPGNVEVAVAVVLPATSVCAGAGCRGTRACPEIAKPVPAAHVQYVQEHHVREAVERRGGPRRTEEDADGSLPEGGREELVGLRVPQLPADAHSKAPDELALRAPRVAPEPRPTERPVADVRKARMDAK